MSPVALTFVLIVLTTIVSGKIVQVHVLARHGQRGLDTMGTPLRFWDGGGELSGHGIASSYALGTALAQRYLNGSSETFVDCNLNETLTSGVALWAQTTDSSTTMLTATAITLGLMANATKPPVDEFTKEPALPGSLTIVPIHTSPAILDIAMRAYEKCPALDDQIGSLWESEAMRDVRTEHKAAFDYITTKVGRQINLHDFLDAFEALSVERAMAIGVDPHADGVIPDEMWSSIVDVGDAIAAKLFASEWATGAISGRLLATIDTYVRAAADPGLPTMPMVILAGHYPLFMALAAALDAYSTETKAAIPSPGALLIIEINEGADREHDVAVVLHDPARGHVFHQLSLRPLETFLTSIELRALGSDNEWCVMCGNIDTPQCVHGAPEPTPICPDLPPPTTSTSWIAPVAGIVAGVAFSALLYMMMIWGKAYRARHGGSSLISQPILGCIPRSWFMGSQTTAHVEMGA